MKYRVFILSLALLAAGSMTLQGKKAKPNAPEADFFKLTVVNSKGKPVNNGSITVYLSTDPERTLLQFKRGVARVYRISPADTLVIFTGRAIASLPIHDLDSARIIIRDAEVIAEPPATILNAGYGEVSTLENTRPANHLSVSDDPTIQSCRDLASYLQGRVSGLQIVQKGDTQEAIIRGTSSFMLSSSALVVVDGVILDSFDDANNTLDLHSIHSIDILKDASIYGSRGANGAILITTKTGENHKQSKR